MYKQSVLLGIVTIFITISVIDYMHFQAPAQSTVVNALEQQTSSSSSSLSNQTEIVVARTPEEKANLERFDQLDFESWNTRNWTLFQEIHGPDVLVVDFSGNTTRGIDQHLDWATAFTSAQPESKVLAHPIKIPAGNWTARDGDLARKPHNDHSCALAGRQNRRGIPVQ